MDSFPSRKTGAIIPDDLFERSSLASVRPKGVAAGASDSQIEANWSANEYSVAQT